jgi:membrane protein implicated in regulation of membrane protease activity
MHLSTRILLLLLATVLIAGGWWLLLANNALATALIYGAIWTAAVLIVTKVVSAIGFGYNRYSAGRNTRNTTSEGTQSALGELVRLRDTGLISAEEYAAKRALVMERI